MFTEADFLHDNHIAYLLNERIMEYRRQVKENKTTLTYEQWIKSTPNDKTSVATDDNRITEP